MRFDDEWLEREIERPATKIAVIRGWIEIKIEGANRNGWPDHLYVRAGRYVWIEYKAPDVEATTQQQRKHNLLRAQGAEVYVVDSLERALEILR